MKITIVSDDKVAVFDATSYHNLLLEKVPADVWALQWDGSKGHIEFRKDSKGLHVPNQEITELPSWVATVKSEVDALPAPITT